MVREHQGSMLLEFRKSFANALIENFALLVNFIQLIEIIWIVLNERRVSFFCMFKDLRRVNFLGIITKWVIRV